MREKPNSAHHWETHYQCLGVAVSATEAEIKKAYRQKARQFHPDATRNPFTNPTGEDTAEAFMRVQEAHTVLMDAQQRAAYNRALGLRSATSSNGGSPATHHTRPHAHAPQHARGTQRAPKAGGIRGPASHATHTQRTQTSQSAAGADDFNTQRNSHKPLQRSDLDAKASLQISLKDAIVGAQHTLTVDCNTPTHRETNARHHRLRTYQVTIPPLTAAGTVLRLPGCGLTEPFTGAVGSLLLSIQFELDATFTPHPTRLGGLQTTLNIAPWDAALGAFLPVNTPEGAAAKLRIPAGSQHGNVLELENCGLPLPAEKSATKGNASKETKGAHTPNRGPLAVKLNLQVPAAKTPAQRDAWRKLAKEQGG